MEPQINTSRGYVNVSEAAHWFGLSESTIRNYVAAGDLPSLRMGGRILIPITALQPDPNEGDR
jgi:excisionase family DNA binding protein